MTRNDDITAVRVQTLERIAVSDQIWPLVADKYCVENPVPPWKSSLEGMCDALDQNASALPALTRRDDEDRLSAEAYETLPYPESRLVALAHSLVARDVIDEEALASRMDQVRARLQAAD